MPEPHYRQVLKFMNVVREKLGEDAYNTLNHHVLERDAEYFHSTEVMEEIVNTLRTDKGLLLRFNMFLEVPLEIWTSEEGAENIVSKWDDDIFLHLGKTGTGAESARESETETEDDDSDISQVAECTTRDTACEKKDDNAPPPRKAIEAEIREELAAETFDLSKMQFSFARSLYKDNQIRAADKETVVDTIVEAHDREAISYREAVHAVHLLQNKRSYITGIRFFLPEHRKIQLWTNSKGNEHIFIRMDEPTSGYSVFVEDLGSPVEVTPEAFLQPKLPRPVLRLSLKCHHCGKRFGKHEYGSEIYPIPSMVCEHSICQPCWHRAIEEKPGKGKWMNCPMVECNKKKAFNSEEKYPNMLAMEVMVKLKDAEQELKFFDKKYNVVRLSQYNDGDPFEDVQ